jgi:hypothetical protein
MASAYPGAIDSFTTKTNGETIAASFFNDPQNAIVAVQTELGTDPAGTMATVDARLDVSLAADGDLAFAGVSTLTISGGSVTVTGNRHLIGNEGAGAADDLDTINGGAAGLISDLRPLSAAQVVTITNAGNIVTPGAANIVLDETAKSVMAIYDSGLSKWRVYPNFVNHFGDNTNYSAFEADGTLAFYGDAMVWDDLRIEPTARTAGNNAPVFEQYMTNGAASRGVYLYSLDDATASNEKELFFTVQMPHSWAGTAIDLHVHWIGSVADTTAEPRFGLEYNWIDIGGTFANTTIVYANVKTPTDANVTAFKHYLTAFTAITPSANQDGISSVIMGRLFRDSANAGDTYNAASNKVGVLYIDVHYEINTIGSREELAK